jgi:hypothetical protein
MKTFPILLSWQERRDYPNYRSTMPLELLAPHEAQAIRNHGGQDLKRLAERGGLGPEEIYYVMHDLRFEFDDKKRISFEDATKYLIALLDKA